MEQSCPLCERWEQRESNGEATTEMEGKSQAAHFLQQGPTSHRATHSMHLKLELVNRINCSLDQDAWSDVCGTTFREGCECWCRYLSTNQGVGADAGIPQLNQGVSADADISQPNQGVGADVDIPQPNQADMIN